MRRGEAARILLALAAGTVMILAALEAYYAPRGTERVVGPVPTTRPTTPRTTTHATRMPTPMPSPVIVIAEPEPTVIERGWEPDLYRITFYTRDTCSKTPDHPAYGITFSGTWAQEGRTIAVDPDVIPIGSIVHIEGWGEYIAEDTGVYGQAIDIFMERLEDIPSAGVLYLRVEIGEAK